MDKNLIAPCGMNCSLCVTYQMKKGDLKKLGKQELIYTIGNEKYTVENGIVFDKDCVAIVNGNRDAVFELFGPKFCFEFTPERWNPKDIKYFPRGFINVDTSIDN